MDHQKPPTKKRTDSTPRLTIVRRGFAGLLILGIAAVAVLSYIPQTGIASCRDAVAGSGTVHVCGPIGPNDAVAVGAVLLVVVMSLWPDLSEFSIAGLLSLRKQVDETRVQALEAGRAAQRAAEDALYANLATEPPSEVEQVARAATERVRSFTAEAVIAPPPRSLSEERGGSEADFLEIARELDPYIRSIALAPTEGAALLHQAQTQGLVPVGDADRQLTALIRWQTHFSTEVRTWVAVRNLVAHGAADRLSDDDMRAATIIANALLTGAQQAVRAASD